MGSSSFSLSSSDDDLEAGFSGSNTPFLSYSSAGDRRRESCRALGWAPSPPPPRFESSASDRLLFYDYDFFDVEPHHHHFLDACFLCKKPLTGKRDIFMYRGDTPFCSEVCREKQIKMDEPDEEESKCNRSKRKQEKSHKSPSKTIHVRPGTVVAG